MTPPRRRQGPTGPSSPIPLGYMSGVTLELQARDHAAMHLVGAICDAQRAGRSHEHVELDVGSVQGRQLDGRPSAHGGYFFQVR